MVFFVLALVAAIVVAAGLALIAISIVTFVAALIAGHVRSRSRTSHQPVKLVHGHH